MEQPFIEAIALKPWLIKVRSKNKRKYYEVIKRKDETFSCTCPAAKYGTSKCKHILAAEVIKFERE